jgi:hypothetical protein
VRLYESWGRPERAESYRSFINVAHTAR